MQMHHFSTFYDVFSSAKLQWPHYLPFLQTMCRAIEVYHSDEAICISDQISDRNQDQNSNWTQVQNSVDFFSFDRNSDRQKLKFVIFQFAVGISVRKTDGIRNLQELRPQFKSEKQPASPIIHAATHAVLFS